MPSTYTVNLGIEKPATGEQSGTWGDTTNTNFDILDQAINGAVRVTLTGTGTSGSPNQIQITDGATSDGRNKWIEIYSASDLGGPSYVELFPNDAEKILFIRNSLAGNQSILLFQGTYDAARDLEVPAGVDMVVKFDGTGASTATVTDVYTKLRVTELTTPTLTATSLTSTSLTATSADINGGTVDNSVIGGTTPAAITGTTITANTSLNIAGDGATVTGIKDEDNMASNSATKLATQQSIKAYVDSQVSTVDTWSEVLANGATSGATSPEVTAGQVLKTDTINETTVGSGVTVDSVLLKDDVVNATDVEVGSISANDGTQAATIANTTGVMTIASSVLTSADINGGSIDGTTIGAATPAAATFTQANFGDNAKALFGAGSDLEIYHDGTNSYLRDIGDGILFIEGSTQIQLRGINGDKFFQGNEDGSSKLYQNDVERLTTTPTGIDVTGDVDLTGELGSSTARATNLWFSGAIDGGDNATIRLGNGDDLQIYHDGADSIISDAGTGRLILEGSTQVIIRDSTASGWMLRGVEGGSTELYHNNSQKLATSAFGVDVFGTLDATGIIDTAAGFEFGSSDNYLYQSGTDEVTLRVGSRPTYFDFHDLGVGTGVRFNSTTTPLYLGAGQNNHIKISAAETVINEDAGTMDFRVESQTNANLLFVDNSANAIGIGTNAPASLLHIASTGEAKLTIEGDSDNDASEEAALLSFKSDAGAVGHVIGIEQGTVNDLVIAAGEGSASHISSGISFKTKTTSTTTPVEYMNLNSTGVLTTFGSAIFNEGGDSFDFRVESNTNENMLFVDGSANFVAIGHNAPLGDLHIKSGASGIGGVSSGGDELIVEASGTGGISIATPNTANGTIYFADPDDQDPGIIYYAHANDTMFFHAGAALRFKLNSTEAVFNETGTGTDFRVESQSNTHAFFLDASSDSGQGRVGIRTSAPSGPLDVRADSDSRTYVGTTGKITTESSAGGAILTLAHTGSTLTDTTASSYIALSRSASIGGSLSRMGYFGYGSISGTTWSWVNEVDGADTRIYTQDSSGNSISHIRLAETESNFNVDQDDLDFRVESTTSAFALFVRASDSKVGINNGSPAHALDVGGVIATTSDVNIAGRIQDSSGDYGTSGQILSSTGVGIDWIDASSGDVTGTGANNGVAVWSGSKSLDFSSTFTWDGSTLVAGSTGASTITTRAYIYYNGAGTQYGINMRPASDNTVSIHFQNASGTNVGSISQTASATTYTTTSDYRIKDNVVALSGAIERVKQLKPKRFNFTATPDVTVDGFLAHEAQAVVPEAITGAKDAVDQDGQPKLQGIDQSKIVPLLTAALQEAVTKIEILEARITALESN